MRPPGPGARAGSAGIQDVRTQTCTGTRTSRSPAAAAATPSERMSRKLHEAPPGGHELLRAAVWTFLRAMLSPRLAELHRDPFMIHEAERSTVDLAARHGDSSLDALDLDEEPAPAA